VKACQVQIVAAPFPRSLYHPRIAHPMSEFQIPLVSTFGAKNVWGKSNLKERLACHPDGDFIGFEGESLLGWKGQKQTNTHPKKTHKPQ